MHIHVFREGNEIFVRVLNSGGLHTVADLGVGIQNIQKRLELQYGERARFSIREIENKNMVEAQIRFKE